MAILSNKSISTATLANKAFSSNSMTWAQAIFTWANAVGTWGNPFNFTNKSVNTATLTNKSRDT